MQVHTPSWSTAALSVRQHLDGAYADRDRINKPDGTWSYRYLQENPDPTERDNVYTNRELMRCHADRVLWECLGKSSANRRRVT